MFIPLVIVQNIFTIHFHTGVPKTGLPQTFHVMGGRSSIETHGDLGYHLRTPAHILMGSTVLPPIKMVNFGRWWIPGQSFTCVTQQEVGNVGDIFTHFQVGGPVGPAPKPWTASGNAGLRAWKCFHQWLIGWRGWYPWHE